MDSSHSDKQSDYPDYSIDLNSTWMTFMESKYLSCNSVKKNIVTDELI